MTTDPTPDWEQLLVKLDRVIEVLEDIRDARRGKTTQRPPTREEIVRFARGGIVKRPEGHQPPIISQGCDYVISPDEAQRCKADTLSDEQKQKFQRIVLNRVVKANERDEETNL